MPSLAKYYLFFFFFSSCIHYCNLLQLWGLSTCGDEQPAELKISPIVSATFSFVVCGLLQDLVRIMVQSSYALIIIKWHRKCFFFFFFFFLLLIHIKCFFGWTLFLSNVLILSSVPFMWYLLSFGNPVEGVNLCFQFWEGSQAAPSWSVLSL